MDSEYLNHIEREIISLRGHIEENTIISENIRKEISEEQRKLKLKLDIVTFIFSITSILILALFIQFTAKINNSYNVLQKTIISLDKNVHEIKDEQSARDMKYFDIIGDIQYEINQIHEKQTD